jgi:ketosteroid isomerase-like protein
MQATAEVREEILLSLGELRAAVSQRRLEGVLTLFAPDADTTVVGSSMGEVARGPLELRALFERLFDGPAVRWEWDVVQTSCAGDVAWLVAEAALVVEGAGARPYRITGVLERRAGRWLWTLFHGSEPS